MNQVRVLFFQGTSLYIIYMILNRRKLYAENRGELKDKEELAADCISVVVMEGPSCAAE